MNTFETTSFFLNLKNGSIYKNNSIFNLVRKTAKKSDKYLGCNRKLYIIFQGQKALVITKVAAVSKKVKEQTEVWSVIVILKRKVLKPQRVPETLSEDLQD